eukprot:1069909-Prorocentrum_minimum.AAC.1
MGPRADGRCHHPVASGHLPHPLHDPRGAPPPPLRPAWQGRLRNRTRRWSIESARVDGPSGNPASADRSTARDGDRRLVTAASRALRRADRAGGPRGRTHRCGGAGRARAWR